MIKRAITKRRIRYTALSYMIHYSPEYIRVSMGRLRRGESVSKEFLSAVFRALEIGGGARP